MDDGKKKYGPAMLILLALSVVLLFSFSFFSVVLAGVGTPNVTVITQLEVGNVYPEVLNVSIDNDASSVTLVANATRLVSCVAVIRDYNGEGDISNVNATFYDSSVSEAFASDDNNYHYSNASCNLTDSFGTFNGYVDDAYHTLANCTFDVWYYANPSTWVCNVTVNDSNTWTGKNYDEVTVDQLLALGLPDVIDYGTVNATEVSYENTSNVTNFGNVAVNLSLEGYAQSPGDGNAMNCSLGSVGNISIEYEKFNLTASNTSVISHSDFVNQYVNLSTTTSVRDFNLTSRTNDALNDAVKPSYWRIYVPIGVAGNCTGNIVFGATTANGS